MRPAGGKIIGFDNFNGFYVPSKFEIQKGANVIFKYNLINNHPVGKIIHYNVQRK